MLRACIFDLDGTLADTLPTVHHYCSNSLVHFGLKAVTLEQCRGLCRLSIAEFYPNLLRLGGCPEERTAELLEPIRQYDLNSYLQDIFYLTQPYPGVTALLEQLREIGVICAVLTNKPAPLAQALMSALFPGLLDVVEGQTPSSVSKPDPRSLTDLLDKLNTDKEDCLYVGDTDVDMRTAQSAGVSACAVTWGYQAKKELSAFSPTWFAESPEELFAICERLNTNHQ